MMASLIASAPIPKWKKWSMLDHFFHFGNGAEAMREAIIFYDMDRLDAPTIGAYI